MLKRVNYGDAVIFDREPYNEYDANAVRISLLDGSQLGYIPRDQTSLFGPLTTGGQVMSVGLGQGGFFGAFVYMQPRLPFLLPAFLPEQHLHYMDPFKELTDKQLQSIRNVLIKRDWTCCLTGVTDNLRPCVFWRVHPKLKQFEMSGIRLVQQDLLQVAYMQSDQDPHLVNILAVVNQ